MQKSLSDGVIRLANEELFAPRGLVVRVCNTEAVRMLVRTGKDMPQQGTGDNVVTAASKFGKELPILGKIIRNLGPEPEALPNDPRMTLTERRIASLAPHVLPMFMNVPPPALGQGRFEQSNARFLEKEGGKVHRKEGRTEENRRLLATARGQAQPVYANRPEFRRRSSSKSSDDSLSSASSADSSEDEDKAMERMQKAANRERKAMRAFKHHKDTSEFARKIEKGHRQDAQTTDDLLWVILLNAEQDREIQQPASGSQGDRDVEVIHESEWNDALKHSSPYPQ